MLKVNESLESFSDMLKGVVHLGFVLMVVALVVDSKEKEGPAVVCVHKMDYSVQFSECQSKVVEVEESTCRTSTRR